jgi:toxin-antitoxin system PIN domain toxin
MVAETILIAIDTNLLIYAHRTGVPEHSAARKAIERASHDPRGIGISLPCIAEFLSIVTHPLAAGVPSMPEQAEKFIASLVEQADVAILAPHPGFAARFLKWATTMAVTGPRVFDLQIAIIAAENGADEIWTHDKNFLRFKGLRVHDPLG